jgi:predicted Zn-dependent peptidase
MRSLEITQAKLDNQRQAVQEERRLRVDNQPYGLADEHFGELFYSNFAYQHSTIGSMEDLNAGERRGRRAVLQDVLRAEQRGAQPGRRLQAGRRDGDDQALLRRHSAPGRAAGGRSERAGAEGRAPRNDDGRAGARDAEQIAYKTPVGNAPDVYALRVLSSVLQSGDSSRLYQLLNKEKELVVAVGGFVDERIGPGGLYIGATGATRQEGR